MRNLQIVPGNTIVFLTPLNFASASSRENGAVPLMQLTRETTAFRE